MKPCSFLLSSTLLLLSAFHLSAANRVALVIGNGTYRELSASRQLTSPVHDAQDVAAALQGMGYTLVTGGAVTDANRETITTATEQFAAAARNADAAVFYYSGHGIQVGDDNYLLPSDTPKLTGLSMLKNRAVLLRDSVMVALEEAEAKTKLIILDCCRDNPFSAQLEQALAQVGKSVRTKSVGEITGYGPGFYLAFATSPGSTAADGNGARNSPFTAAMLQALPGSAAKDIDFYFRDVKALLPDDQVSWTNHSIKGSFVLVPGGSQPPMVNQPTVLPSVPPQPSNVLDSGAVGKAIQVKLPGEVVMKFSYCPAGSFTMGSPAEEVGHSDDEEQVQVRITQGFWMGQTEVTQGQWLALMGTTPAQQKAKENVYGEVNGLGADHPMYFVSWEDAQAFIAKLNQNVPLGVGWKYALPTEAQWEYACRAGTEGVFSFGDVLNGKQANCNGYYPYGTSTKGASLEKTCVVGSYAPNPWGLFDMHGNAWEWCQDVWDGESKLPGGTDPLGASGSSRVGRGGSWDFAAQNCRAATRFRNLPGIRLDYLGFRVAAVPAGRR